MPRGLPLFLVPVAALAALLPIGGGGDPSRAPSPNASFPVGAPLFVDDGGPPGARTVWGSVDCAQRNRVRTAAQGGDPASRADGTTQSSPGFRRLRVLDGDDYYGERCELGENWRPTTPMPLYQDGTREITFFSVRLSPGFPLERRVWQSVMQMKQSQPADDAGGRPMLSLQAYDGRWRLRSGARSVARSEIWSTRATPGRWVRFAFDVTYSADPSVGAVRVGADLNADGDFRDRGELSGTQRVATLKLEGPGTESDGLAEGDAVPSHLRIGIYHDPSFRCHRYKCSLGVDNVGVYTTP
jgi:Polysaccharide lyase